MRRSRPGARGTAVIEHGRSLCDEVGIARPGGKRVRIHDLRHTAATWLHGQGVDMKTIQGTLRHSRLAITSEIYTHLTEEVQRRAADSMDGALSRFGRLAQ
ncbi:tyrosine-type recombinase/integrase [Nonomuraea sp. NPDC049158]|uniref:tyrosine-type recombinase/integrase n=1 Tax=Nonomuraea sp. NPDC049158 TaxID=3155649 RepID=UPI0033E6D2F0